MRSLNKSETLGQEGEERTMNEVTLPDGWEPCNPSECTAIWSVVGRQMFNSLRGESSDDSVVAVGIYGQWICEHVWPILGIIPIRKAPPPEPIEFVLGEPLITNHECEDSYDITSEYTRTSFELPKSVRPGMRFREVRD